MLMIRTSILLLNDRLLDVRTACERNPIKDTPTANPNTSQANILSTPVKSFRRRCDMDVQTGAHSAQVCEDMDVTEGWASVAAYCHENLTLRLGFIDRNRCLFDAGDQKRKRYIQMYLMTTKKDEDTAESTALQRTALGCLNLNVLAVGRVSQN
jgi:hypothetical protein